MEIRDKTQTYQKAQSLQRTTHNNKYCPLQQIQPNYYLSVASVDSSTTESTYIFPETLNKCINACGKYKLNKNNFLISRNTQ